MSGPELVRNDDEARARRCMADIRAALRRNNCRFGFKTMVTADGEAETIIQVEVMKALVLPPGIAARMNGSLDQELRKGVELQELSPEQQPPGIEPPLASPPA